MTYFVMIGLSVSVAAIATLIGQKITQLRNAWTGTLCGAGIFIVLIALVQFGLPDVNEVPEGFPALVLWRFREASIGMQLVLWSTMGLLFGVLATRVLTEQSSSARR
jgi:predicted cobalt transporter CbtA